MKPPIITPIQFVDDTSLSEIHSDNRRTLYERIIHSPSGMRRLSRSVVTADEAVLGNHYHNFKQSFKGCGKGILYTAPKDDPANVTVQELPAGGWAFTIPAGMVMALRLKKGTVQLFESDKTYQDGANTHRVVIAS